MLLFSSKKNKEFSYRPYYFKPIENPFKIKQKFEEHRTTLDNKKLKQQIQQAFGEAKQSNHFGFNKIILLNIFVLTFIFLVIIEFDFSIFS